MGLGIEIYCNKCSFAVTDSLTIGVSFGCFADIFTILHKRRQREITTILRTHTIQDFDYSLELLICGSCSKIHERFFVKMRYQQNNTYETTYKCPKCKQKLRLLSDTQNINKMLCPQCCNKSLSFSRLNVGTVIE